MGCGASAKKYEEKGEASAASSGTKAPKAKRKKEIILAPEFENTCKLTLRMNELQEKGDGSKDAALTDVLKGVDEDSLRASASRSVRIKPIVAQKYRVMLLQRWDELKKDGDNTFRELFEDADKNTVTTKKDWRITEQEFRTLCMDSAKTDWEKTHLTEEETTVLFWHLDIDSSGEVDFNELKHFLSRKESGAAMKKIDLEKGRRDELMEILRVRDGQMRGSDANARNAFNALFKSADLDNNQRLDIEEFRKLCQNTSYEHARLSERESMALFWHLDKDNSGNLSVQELRKWLMEPFPDPDAS